MRQSGPVARWDRAQVAWLALLLVAVAFLLGACRPQGDVAPAGEPTTTPPPGGPPAEMPRAGANQVAVTLMEYRIDMPASIPAGATAFEVTNAGEMPHNLRVQGEGADVSFSSDLEPGETAILEVALEPGSYVVTCPIANHAELGMREELTVVPRS